MRWLNVNSVEELKSLGKFREVSREIKEDVGNNIKITGRGWNDIYENIIKFRNVIKKVDNYQQKNNDSYFVSPTDEYIFYLTELDGEIRMNKLGITKTHFTNKKKAKQWRDTISKQIHPDVSKHKKSEEAMAKLNSIYSLMVGKES